MIDRNNQEVVLPVVTKLVQIGADPRATSGGNATALHLLIGNLNNENVKGTLVVATELVHLGVDPDAKENGNTALHWLVDRRLDQQDTSIESMLSAITTLVNLGMDPNAETMLGRTALNWLLHLPVQDNVEALEGGEAHSSASSYVFP